MSARKNYGRLGVYDPPEPNVRVLPTDARARWEQVYADAMAAYGRKEVAEATAWRTIRMSWRPDNRGRSWIRCTNNRCVKWPRPQQLPRPKSELVGLGVLIEYGYVDADGELQIVRANTDTPPMLYWDHVAKRLYAFPYAGYGTCDAIPSTPPMQMAAKVYKMWAKGRKPQCATKVQAPKTRVFAAGVADTISYRSDKYDGPSELRIIDLRGVPMQDASMPNSTPYIHKHWHDVWTWVDDEDDPWVIMIEGGALDVHAKGIIH